MLTIILYLLGMHRATAASAISQSLLTNRRSPHLLFTAGFANYFNALIFEAVLVDLHKYILPSYYVITCIRLFFTKHYWGLFAENAVLAIHTEKQRWQPPCFHVQIDTLVFILKVQQQLFLPKTSCGEEGLTVGNIWIGFSDIDRKKTVINWWI